MPPTPQCSPLTNHEPEGLRERRVHPFSSLIRLAECLFGAKPCAVGCPGEPALTRALTLPVRFMH